MVQHLFCFLVSAPLSWAKNPSLVDIIWSTETVSSDLVATNLLDSLPHQGSLVIAPNRQPAHLGAGTNDIFLGISPLMASCFNFEKERWPKP